VLDAAVNDVRGVHAGTHGIQCRADLRQHAAADDAVGDESRGLLLVQALQQPAVGAEDPGRVGEHDQLLRTQHLRQLAGDQIRVDVVGLPLLSHADRRDHGNEIAGDQHVDHRRVDAGYLAHVADVDDLGRLQLRAVARHHELSRPDEIPILAAQADRAATVLVDEVDDLLVYQPAEHHFHDVHGLAVGHAHAVHEAALLADAREQLADLGPAAVHDDRVHADQLHQRHVAGEAALQGFVGHGGATVLDDDGLVVEATDVRQRLGENPGDVGRAGFPWPASGLCFHGVPQVWRRVCRRRD